MAKRSVMNYWTKLIEGLSVRLIRLINTNLSGPQDCGCTCILSFEEVPTRPRVQTMDGRRLKGVDEGLIDIRPVHHEHALMSESFMQVYLPAIVTYLPRRMVRSLRHCLDFTYLVRRSTISTKTLKEAEAALRKFHHERQVFIDTGVRAKKKGFSLPRQHSLSHYPKNIRRFGAPNGLCSSITESKHIKAVKEPWRRSNRFNALRQILLINMRLDKLSACRTDFLERGMLLYLRDVYMSVLEEGQQL